MRLIANNCVVENIKKVNYFNLACNWIARTLVIYFSLYCFILLLSGITSFIAFDPEPFMNTLSASMLDKDCLWIRSVFVASMVLSGIYSRFMFDCYNKHENNTNLLNVKRYFKK